jgi:iron(III) transport system ATP-binding protein
MLLDEPLSNLDAELRTQMRHELRALQRKLGVTTLFVTHDQEEALSMSDRIALFEHGELIEVGDPRSLYLRPRKRFTASFLGLGDPIPCTVVERSAAAGTACVETSFGRVVCDEVDMSVGQRCRLLVRPEHVLIEPPELQGVNAGPSVNAWIGTVTEASFAGRYVEYDISVGGVTLQAQIPSVLLHEVGSAVRVHLPPQRCVLLVE